MKSIPPNSSSAAVLSEKLLWGVLAAHLLLWTLVPALVNGNLPLDVVEALAWGREWQLGYPKHPPLSAWMAEAVTVVLGRQPWGMYLLSSLCITSAIALVYATAKRLAPHTHALVGALLLEGVYYHNFTSPEFNVNICIMPMLGAMAYTLVRGLESGRVAWWVLSGVFAGLAVLGKYTAGMLLGPVVLVTLLHPRLRKSYHTPGPYFGLIACALVVSPHVWWIVQSKGQTLGYAAQRAGSDDAQWYDHLLQPIAFAGDMAAVMALVLILAWPLLWPGKLAGSVKAQPDEPREETDGVGLLDRSARAWLVMTLAFGGLVSFALMSLLTGWQVRSMWAAPMFLFAGLALVQLKPPTLSPATIRRFKLHLAVVLLLPVFGYAGMVLIKPMTGGAKRVHFPGPQLAMQVSEAWGKRYDRPLPIAAGRNWVAGCVSYYAEDRPSAYLNVDPLGTAWCDDERLNREGGVIMHVLYKKLPLDAPPDEQWTDWQMRFPAMEIQPRLILPQQAVLGEPKPVAIDWAIIPPADTLESD